MNRSPLLLMCGVALVLGCESNDAGGDGVAEKQSLQEQLCRLDRGVSLDSVGQAMKNMPRHEFQVARDNNHIMCVSYGVNINYVRLYLLFENGSLSKLIEPPSFQYHEIPYQGTSKLSVRSPWKTSERIETIISSADLSFDECMDSLHSRAPKSTKEDGLNVSVLFGGGYSQEWRTALEERAAANEKIAAFMDPLRFRPGMSISIPIQKLGPPSCERFDEQQGRIRVFLPPGHGSHMVSGMAPSPVTVISKNEIINAVYSDDFYNPDECTSDENTD